MTPRRLAAIATLSALLWVRVARVTATACWWYRYGPQKREDGEGQPEN